MVHSSSVNLAAKPSPIPSVKPTTFAPFSVSQDILPQSNPHAGYIRHHAEILGAIIETLDSGHLILGPQTAHFEEMFSAFLGRGETIGVASGTDALVIALRTCGIGPGDAVLTVAHTAVATVAAIEIMGAVPVLADIDPVSFTLSPESLASTIEEYRTSPESDEHPLKAVIAVHLYGHPADLPAIAEICERYQLLLIEDCAQAHGATFNAKMVGTWGHAAAFSFYPTKNLGALGDGGAVVSCDPHLAERARLLREYGWKDRYVSNIAGMNSRLDEVQSAVLRVRLSYLPQDNASRCKIAETYQELLESTPVTCPSTNPSVTHVFHQYVLRYTDRDVLRFYLKDLGINTLVHYPVPIHQQPAYQGRLFIGEAGLPHTELAAQEILSLPMYPELTEEDVNRVGTGIRRFFR